MNLFSKIWTKFTGYFNGMHKTVAEVRYNNMRSYLESQAASENGWARVEMLKSRITRLKGDLDMAKVDEIADAKAGVKNEGWIKLTALIQDQIDEAEHQLFKQQHDAEDETSKAKTAASRFAALAIRDRQLAQALQAKKGIKVADDSKTANTGERTMSDLMKGGRAVVAPGLTAEMLDRADGPSVRSPRPISTVARTGTTAGYGGGALIEA